MKHAPEIDSLIGGTVSSSKSVLPVLPKPVVIVMIHPKSVAELLGWPHLAVSVM